MLGARPVSVPPIGLRSVAGFRSELGRDLLLHRHRRRHVVTTKWQTSRSAQLPFQIHHATGRSSSSSSSLCGRLPMSVTRSRCACFGGCYRRHIGLRIARLGQLRFHRCAWLLLVCVCRRHTDRFGGLALVRFRRKPQQSVNRDLDLPCLLDGRRIAAVNLNKDWVRSTQVVYFRTRGLYSCCDEGQR